ncbi:MAG: DNA-directed DNA polymerase eta rad30 [Chaenotheca gracillima]|nr:MAG: DNA-directed DNA polymerase eta rad30 [Chaenotheca gracillima]
MTSPEPFVTSSSQALISDGRPGRKSEFTYRHLAQLATSSTTCPLRTIAHIDLDAFYAQCEMIRLGVPEDRPLAVQQWRGLIAINYPARKYGISRHAKIEDARKLCPDLIMQHVATWKEGEEKWAYHGDVSGQLATHKVSLDPYRLQSRKILSVIKESLPAPPLQRVEKASIDEVFLDLSAQVHSVLLERYPELSGPAPYDDPSESLPRPPTTVLDWKTDALIDLDRTETEDDDPDWDDIAMLIGSEIVRSVRSSVREHLGFTCSAGVASNKMLSKLGSAYKKPNQQTIVRNRAVQQFLSGMKFTKIRNLGGKLGEQVVEKFGCDTIEELLKVSSDQLKLKLGDDTGSWVYQIIRGIDSSQVNPRTQIKSMLSAKAFRPFINQFEQAIRWLRIFVADIFSRLVEEGVLENKRRPKTINLHHLQGGHSRSKQVAIPQGRPINEALLFELAKNLLSQFVAEGRVWPCRNLSLSVGGFEDGPTGTQGISAFLVKGEEARTMQPAARESRPDLGRPEKKRKIDTNEMQAFFTRQDSSSSDLGAPADDNNADDISALPGDSEEERTSEDQTNRDSGSTPPPNRNELGGLDRDNQHMHERDIEKYFCKPCSRSLLASEKDEHDDWHFARAIQDQEKAGQSVHGGNDRPEGNMSDHSSHHATTSAHTKSGPSVKKRGRITSNSRTAKAEKNQSKLSFGS